jgi:hypothetical protein
MYLVVHVGTDVLDCHEHADFGVQDGAEICRCCELDTLVDDGGFVVAEG